MTGILATLMGRLPIGWLQLTHNRGRLVAAVAGVAFANLLVFVQLGIMAGLNNSILASYDLFKADIMISAKDANTLTEGNNIPRQMVFRAMSVNSVAAATPIYIANMDWERTDGSRINFQIIGVDVDATDFIEPSIADKLSDLRVPNTVLMDTKTRFLDGENFAGLSPQNPFQFELNGNTISAIDTIGVGGGFNADGVLFTSDQTFLSIFEGRSSSAPNHVLVNVQNNVKTANAVNQILSVIPKEEARVRSLEDAAIQDQVYQTTERPTGLIFGFGVIMGIIVGVVIVYQILSTDVADHMREYATFKAMGYPQTFFLGIVFEQAFILAILGFIPGFLLSWGIHLFLVSATGLPIFMEFSRSVSVMLGTILACAISGAIATRRLNSADPADLF